MFDLDKTTYTITIDEPQRLALLALTSRTDIGNINADNHPLQYWREMLAELPDNEKKEPGIAHGFCY